MKLTSIQAFYVILLLVSALRATSINDYTFEVLLGYTLEKIKD